MKHAPCKLRAARITFPVRTVKSHISRKLKIYPSISSCLQLLSKWRQCSQIKLDLIQLRQLVLLSLPSISRASSKRFMFLCHKHKLLLKYRQQLSLKKKTMSMWFTEVNQPKRLLLKDKSNLSMAIQVCHLPSGTTLVEKLRSIGSTTMASLPIIAMSTRPKLLKSQHLRLILGLYATQVKLCPLSLWRASQTRIEFFILLIVSVVKSTFQPSNTMFKMGCSCLTTTNLHAWNQSIARRVSPFDSPTSQPSNSNSTGLILKVSKSNTWICHQVACGTSTHMLPIHGPLYSTELSRKFWQS